MTIGPVFIDVNIPMYAGGASHPYREPCAWVMSAVANGEVAGVIDTEIIQEILHRFGALGRWGDATKMAATVLAIAPVVLPVTEKDVALTIEHAATYGPMGVKARDLLHAAVMRNNELDTIVTLDTHFDQIAGLVRLDPRTLYEAAS